jgi:hypothetical protein
LEDFLGLAIITRLNEAGDDETLVDIEPTTTGVRVLAWITPLAIPTTLG